MAEVTPVNAILGVATQSIQASRYGAQANLRAEELRENELAATRKVYGDCYTMCHSDQNQSCTPCHRLSSAYAALLQGTGATH